MGDEPAALTFSVQVDDFDRLRPRGGRPPIDEAGTTPDEPTSPGRFASASTRSSFASGSSAPTRSGAHCAAFATRSCSTLPHHARPDPEGKPVVTNGLALCKLHHAAFDRFFFAIRPDYRIEVRPSILAEHDGPMLVVGLQGIHGQRILLPRRVAQQPDPARLQRRYEEFLQAG